jgi:hypothetical protein
MPCSLFIGTVVLAVAAHRTWLTGIRAPFALAVGRLRVKAARVSDQAWAERPAARSATTRTNAPKIAAESAA